MSSLATRHIPRSAKGGGLEYITTIVGAEGRQNDLWPMLDKALRKNTEEGYYYLSIPFVTHAAVLDGGNVEFDIYHFNKRRFHTDTEHFREAVGQLTTLLLQTGYHVSSTSDERRRHAAHPRLDF